MTDLPLLPPSGIGAERRYMVALTAQQVQSLYLTLFRGRIGGKDQPELRPAWGWMEQPLLDIEAALAPLHEHLHDGNVNSMNRQFFGDDSRAMSVAEAPALPLLPGTAVRS